MSSGPRVSAAARRASAPCRPCAPRVAKPAPALLLAAVGARTRGLRTESAHCLAQMAGPDAISSKAELARALGLERPLKKNKERGDAALKSCLEVLSEYLAVKAAAATEKSGGSGAKQPAASAPLNDTPASPPRRDAAPSQIAAPPNTAAPAPVPRPSMGNMTGMKPARISDRSAPIKRPDACAPSEDLLVEDLEEFDLDDEGCGAGSIGGPRVRGGGSAGAGKIGRLCRAAATRFLLLCESSHSD